MMKKIIVAAALLSAHTLFSASVDPMDKTIRCYVEGLPPEHNYDTAEKISARVKEKFAAEETALIYMSCHRFNKNLKIEMNLLPGKEQAIINGMISALKAEFPNDNTVRIWWNRDNNKADGMLGRVTYKRVKDALGF